MLRGLALTLLTAGLCLLGVSGLELVARERHQALELGKLEPLLQARRAVEGGVVSASASRARMRASQNAAWGRLELRRVGLSVVVDEGVDGPTLDRAVGHVPGSSFPGEPGNVVLAGHRAGLFRPLRSVRTGDRLRLTTLDGSFDYDVDEILIVPPERSDVLAAGAHEQLTLVTCYPFRYVGPAPLRFVVKAKRRLAALATSSAPDFAR